MNLDIYQVDAFSAGPFTGNPAAVVPLESWLSDDLLQKIALENNLSETAFFVKEEGQYHIRWFTPGVEVALCGHATLATAFVIFTELNHPTDRIDFTCKSGDISVSKEEDRLTLDFPTDHLVETPELKEQISNAIGAVALEVWTGKTDILCLLESQQQVAELTPDFLKVSKLDCRGLLVTAQGNGEYNFVSRGFFPLTGVNEDPATGSAHTSLVPFWARRLKQTQFKTCQLSYRKGFFNCEHKGSRTLISGRCDLYLKGQIMI